MSSFVQRSDARFVTHGDGWVGRFCFSYGEHYEPSNVSFGMLVACNDFVIEPGAGFGRHHHGGVEVVSWVLSGTLLHDEVNLLPTGSLQLLSTGAGVEHSETNPGPAPLRLLQMWLVPEENGLEPAHHLVEAPSSYGLVDLPLRQPAATLYAGSLAPGSRVELPDAPFVFVFVADGTVELAGESLEPGDSARLSAPAALTATTDARVLVWAMKQP